MKYLIITILLANIKTCTLFSTTFSLKDVSLYKITDLFCKYVLLDIKCTIMMKVMN